MIRRTVAAALVVASIASVLALGAPVAGARPSSPSRATEVPLIDPGVPGDAPIDELTYDFGDQAFAPVGFPARVELRAKVYAPQAIDGRAPLVIVQHGRHGVCATTSDEFFGWPCPASIPEIPSYAGYDALGRNLASHGAIVVSIGANGINANDGFLADGGASARAQLILEHLRRWRGWDAAADGSPFGDRFVGHVDLGRVGLVGHSRGGEGVAAAVQLNQRIGAPFGIRAAVLLAPVDFDRRIVGGVELAVILPYCDGDVSDLQGASYYDDGRYASPGDPTSKSTYLLYGANHNYFNTVWTTGPGSFDDAGLVGVIDGQPSAAIDNPCEPGGAARLAAADQEQAGATLMAGFLRRHLAPEPGLTRFVTGAAPFPASVGPARWAVAYHAAARLDVATWSSVADARSNALEQVPWVVGPVTGAICNAGLPSGFGPPSPQGTVTQPCPSSEGLAATNDTGVLDVGWTHQGTFVRQPLDPAGTDVTAYDGLRFRAAVVQDSRNAARARQDLTIVLEDVHGARASVLASTGTNALGRLNRGLVLHALLNGVRVPLSAFGGIDLARVRAVELRFDRTGAGRLTLADLAFTREDVGAAAANTVGVAPLAPPRPACRGAAAQRWACALVQLAWGRDPDDAELRTVAAGYATADSRRRTVANLLATPAARAQVLGRFVQVYAGDQVDPEYVDAILDADGERWWDVGRRQLVPGLVYASPALGTPADVVGALYLAYLGRRADPSGLAHWTAKVAADPEGGPRQLAASLAATATHRGRIVDERYRQVLGRAPDPSGRAYWVGRLASRGGEQALVASLLGTEAFRAWAVH